jgi:hypothetical protein
MVTIVVVMMMVMRWERKCKNFANREEEVDVGSARQVLVVWVVAMETMPSLFISSWKVQLTNL